TKPVHDVRRNPARVQRVEVREREIDLAGEPECLCLLHHGGQVHRVLPALQQGQQVDNLVQQQVDAFLGLALVARFALEVDAEKQEQVLLVQRPQSTAGHL